MTSDSDKNHNNNNNMKCLQDTPNAWEVEISLCIKQSNLGSFYVDSSAMKTEFRGVQEYDHTCKTT